MFFIVHQSLGIFSDLFRNLELVVTLLCTWRYLQRRLSPLSKFGKRASSIDFDERICAQLATWKTYGQSRVAPGKLDLNLNFGVTVFDRTAHQFECPLLGDRTVHQNADY